ncbi:MAG: hypothetical protein ACK2U9_25135 [Anaerolineae bacterium]
MYNGAGKGVLLVNCIIRREFAAQAMVRTYPPRPHHRNKRIVYEMTCPPEATHSGTLAFSRWRPTPLPETLVRDPGKPLFELREDFFTYDPPQDGWIDWHLNFAHNDLFSFYDGPLFAQDEMQVAEHPGLASLRHGLIASGVAPLAVENGLPTPALVMGVERRCSIATEPNAAEGRPDGLYGNNFAAASAAAIRRATRLLEPPTRSNIIAMEAPAYGSGPYTREQIEFIWSTAYTGFAAAVQESRRMGGQEMQVAIHTGYWGCGAYGGNRVLMPLLQLIAAGCLDLDLLVFHAGPDSTGYREAKQLLATLLPADEAVMTAELLARITQLGFRWGIGDGT